MNDISFLHPERVHLLWAAFAAVVLLAALELRGRDLLERFVSRAMQPRLVRQMSGLRRGLRLVLVAGTVVFAALALMRPQTRSVESFLARKVSADVMVVLDLSKSMLATDAAPNRLERAKADLRDMLPQLRGDRVGLVGFAGRATVLCPLTTDHSFFRNVLDAADLRSVARGGTQIGAGIRKALEAFGEQAGPRLIVLVTDGEDHDSYPLDAADAARKAGVPIVAIGFGSEEGSLIEYDDPDTGVRKQLLDSAQQPVRSHLDGETLRQIALATQGVYVPAGTAVLDLEGILAEHIAPLLEAPQEATVRELHSELYPWALLAALLCLVAAALVESPLFAGSPRAAAPSEGASS